MTILHRLSFGSLTGHLLAELTYKHFLSHFWIIQRNSIK